MPALEDAEMRRRVAEARVARLATITSEGRPHLVPITFVCAGDTLYTAVDRKPKRTGRLKRLENIRANPRVTVLVDRYSDDWSQLWWVRMDGTARVLDAGEERERTVGLLRDKYEQYRREPPDGPVIAIRAHTWRGWEAHANI